MSALRRWLSLGFFFAFQLGFVRPVLRWYWGARYRRRGPLPEGPCIVVANHNSHLDAPLLMTMFPIRRITKIHPVAAADYFGKTAWRRTTVMIGMNAMGIERTAAAGRDVLQPMIDALEAGKTLIFFPEGSRGQPGVIGSFKPGIGKIVKTVPNLVVLPVFLSGAERSLPRGESVPLPLGIDVIIGKPRTYDPALDAREIAEMIRADVLALAPSRPAAPGPRPAPPVRVDCCGIDREANRTLSEAIGRRLQNGNGARFVVTDGSPLAVLLAATEAEGMQQLLPYVSGARRIPLSQWPRVIRKAPGVWLRNVLDLAQPPVPDVLVLTNGEPVSESERRLQEGYQRVAGALRKRRIEVVELAARDLDVESAALGVEGICRRLAGGNLRAGGAQT